MKRTILSMIAFAGTVGALTGAPAETCSNNSLRGTYGFHGLAIIASPGTSGTPRAIIGLFTLDGHGNFTTALTINDNGTVTQRPDGGTYVVNADCTGTLIANSGGSIEIVIVDGGNEFYQMRTVPASVVLYGVTKKVSPIDRDRR